ncbi:DUF4345 domain-containing protein [Devosia lacusdianchii]|uniref:DUF4345 domain-containing protein n=1 Tax=Devosia lacusdianchii TaxID=2917991 RepID=UPI001F05A156|nr:DUF4345 domain-containing protein [Devosia sp. JXJ CY 41]
MLVKAFLVLAGVIGIGLGGTILLAPLSFYAGYGLDLTGQITLLNEMRSHGLSLMALGGIIVGGVFVPRLANLSLLAATGLYLSYGVSRLIAVALDGRPADGLLVATAIELAIGSLGLVLYLRHRNRTALAAA